MTNNKHVILSSNRAQAIQTTIWGKIVSTEATLTPLKHIASEIEHVQ